MQVKPKSERVKAPASAAAVAAAAVSAATCSSSSSFSSASWWHLSTACGGVRGERHWSQHSLLLCEGGGVHTIKFSGLFPGGALFPSRGLGSSPLRLLASPPTRSPRRAGVSMVHPGVSRRALATRALCVCSYEVYRLPVTLAASSALAFPSFPNRRGSTFRAGTRGTTRGVGAQRAPVPTDDDSPSRLEGEPVAKLQRSTVAVPK